MKKTATKERKVRISVEEAEKGEKALSREDKRQYHDAVSEERKMEEDGEKRESRNTGGVAPAAMWQHPNQTKRRKKEGRQMQ